MQNMRNVFSGKFIFCLVKSVIDNIPYPLCTSILVFPISLFLRIILSGDIRECKQRKRVLV